MNLFEYDDAIYKCVDEETGEIDQEAMAALEMERDAKVESLGLWVKEMDAEAKAIREEEKKLAERRQALEKRAESVKGYLQAYLNGEKFKTPRIAFQWRTVKKVNIIDASILSPDLLRMRDPEPDKEAIKQALKDGLIVPGAELVESTSMIIK